MVKDKTCVVSRVTPVFDYERIPETPLLTKLDARFYYKYISFIFNTSKSFLNKIQWLKESKKNLNITFYYVNHFLQCLHIQNLIISFNKKGLGSIEYHFSNQTSVLVQKNIIILSSQVTLHATGSLQ
jgi:hypothetical protein